MSGGKGGVEGGLGHVHALNLPSSVPETLQYSLVTSPRRRRVEGQSHTSVASGLAKPALCMFQMTLWPLLCTQQPDGWVSVLLSWKPLKMLTEKSWHSFRVGTETLPTPSHVAPVSVESVASTCRSTHGGGGGGGE